MTALTFRCEIPPMLVNQETKKGSYHARAEMRRQWREHFWALAVTDKVGSQPPSVIEVRHTKTKGTLPDVASCLPSVKAAVDGLVDAGLWPDDSPAWVRAITFYAPEKGDEDVVELTVREIESRAA